MSTFSLRPVTMDDIHYVATHMRQADRDELAVTAAGESYEDVLWDGVQGSAESYTGVVDGKVALIAGVVKHAHHGVPWMLTTPHIEEARFEFLAESREMIKKWVSMCGPLVQAVDARNTLSLRWLEWLKFHNTETCLTECGNRFNLMVRPDNV